MKSLPDFRAAKASLGREAMQWTRIQRNWNEFRGKVKEKWEKLTDDDLRVIDGRRDKLEGKIQQRYGFASDHVRKEVDDWAQWQTIKTTGRSSPGFFLERNDWPQRTPR